MTLVESCVFPSVTTFVTAVMENTESKNTILAPWTLQSKFKRREETKPGRQTKGDGTESSSLGSIFQRNSFSARFSKELELHNWQRLPVLSDSPPRKDF